jgi:hypothetical protein
VSNDRVPTDVSVEERVEVAADVAAAEPDICDILGVVVVAVLIILYELAGGWFLIYYNPLK